MTEKVFSLSCYVSFTLRCPVQHATAFSGRSCLTLPWPHQPRGWRNVEFVPTLTIIFSALGRTLLIGYVFSTTYVFSQFLRRKWNCILCSNTATLCRIVFTAVTRPLAIARNKLITHWHACLCSCWINDDRDISDFTRLFRIPFYRDFFVIIS